MRLLLLALTLHQKTTLTPPKMYQLVNDEESAALIFYNQSKTAPSGATVTAELFEVDLVTKQLKEVSVPTIRFETLKGSL